MPHVASCITAVSQYSSCWADTFQDGYRFLLGRKEYKEAKGLCMSDQVLPEIWSCSWGLVSNLTPPESCLVLWSSLLFWFLLTHYRLLPCCPVQSTNDADIGEVGHSKCHLWINQKGLLPETWGRSAQVHMVRGSTLQRFAFKAGKCPNDLSQEEPQPALVLHKSWSWVNLPVESRKSSDSHQDTKRHLPLEVMESKLMIR